MKLIIIYYLIFKRLIFGGLIFGRDSVFLSRGAYIRGGLIFEMEFHEVGRTLLDGLHD